MDIYQKIIQYYKGNWIYNKGKITIKLTLDDEICKIDYDGKVDEFKINSNPIHNYLYLNQLYCIKYANENELKLRKDKGDDVDDIEKEYKFIRV